MERYVRQFRENRNIEAILTFSSNEKGQIRRELDAMGVDYSERDDTGIYIEARSERDIKNIVDNLSTIVSYTLY